MRFYLTVFALALTACGPKELTPEDSASTSADSTAAPVTAGNSSITDASASTSSSDPTVPPDPTVSSVPPDPITTTANPTAASTPTTDTDDSDTDDSASETGGCSFLAQCDDVPQIECDAFQQDCPEGQKCAAFAHDGGTAWNSLKCVPVAPEPKQPGEPCTAEGLTGVDDCALGSMCFFQNDQDIGACVPLCTGTLEKPVCPADSVCALANDDVLTLCLPPCETDADCPEGQVCFAVGTTLVCGPL